MAQVVSWDPSLRTKFRPLGSWVGSTERYMTTLQAVALGAMLGWTPSLIILAVSLWDIPELEGME